MGLAVLTIGKAARAAGVGVETIRFYERRGLIPRPRKPARGFREYDADTVARIRFIRQAQELGFTLREIKELLSLRTDPTADCADVRTQAEAKLSDVTDKIEALQHIRRGLQTLIAACPSRGPVKACTILEALTRRTVRPALAHRPRSRSPTPKDRTMKTLELRIEGMRCDGCAETVKALIKTEPGVQTATVSFKDRSARILYDPKTTDEARLISAIRKVGYSASGSAA